MKKILQACACSLPLFVATTAFALGPRSVTTESGDSPTHYQTRQGEAHGDAAADGKGGASDDQRSTHDNSRSQDKEIESSDGGRTASSSAKDRTSSGSGSDGSVQPKEP